MKRLSIIPAVFDNDIPELERLVKKGADPNERHCWGEPMLTKAIDNCDFKTARKLLELGADPNLADLNTGLTCFHYAVSSRCIFPEEVIDTVKLMLEKGANVDIEDNKGCDALYWSLSGRWRETIRMVIRAGANLHKVYKQEGNQNILFRAVYYATPKFVNWLIREKGVDKNHINYNGDNLIDFAAKMNCGWMIKTLVDNGLDINAQNDDGNTALHKCVLSYQCPYGMVDVFHKNGFDFNIKNKNGLTVLDLAENNGHFDTWVQKLKKLTKTKARKP